jgi:hypothetical protein
MILEYTRKEDAEHLISTLKAQSGDTYLGMHLDWNYKQQHVDISMPNYVAKALLALLDWV